jgi:hypothetical protein
MERSPITPQNLGILMQLSVVKQVFLAVEGRVTALVRAPKDFQRYGGDHCLADCLA